MPLWNLGASGGKNIKQIIPKAIKNNKLWLSAIKGKRGDSNMRSDLDLASEKASVRKWGFSRHLQSGWKSAHKPSAREKSTAKVLSKTCLALGRDREAGGGGFVGEGTASEKQHRCTMRPKRWHTGEVSGDHRKDSGFILRAVGSPWMLLHRQPHNPTCVSGICHLCITKIVKKQRKARESS